MVSGAGRSVTRRSLCARAARCGQGVRVEPVADPAGLGGRLPITQGTDPAGPGGQLGIHPGPVRAGQAGGLPGDQGGPPLRGLPGAQRGQGVRQLPDQRPGQAQVPGAPHRAVAAGQPDLRGDPGPDPPLGQTRRPLRGPLGGVEPDRHPRLRRGRGGLQPLQHRELLHPLRIRHDAGVVVRAVPAEPSVLTGRLPGSPSDANARTQPRPSTRGSRAARVGQHPGAHLTRRSSIMCSILDVTADRIESRNNICGRPAPLSDTESSKQQRVAC